MTCSKNCGDCGCAKGDSIGQLFAILGSIDAKVTLYGMPVTEEELRTHVARKARERLTDAIHNAQIAERAKVSP